MAYKVKQVTPRTVTLDVAGTLTTDKDKPVAMGPNKMTYDLKGEQASTLVLSRDNGRIKTGKMTQNIDGTMKVEAQGQTMDVPMHVKTTATFEAQK